MTTFALILVAIFCAMVICSLFVVPLILWTEHRDKRQEKLALERRIRWREFVDVQPDPGVEI